MLIRRKSKKRRIVVNVFIGLVSAFVIFIGLVIVMYFMAIYKPSVYNPQPVSFARQEEAVDQAISLVADIHNNVYASESFFESIPAGLVNTLLLHEDLTRMLEKEFAGSNAVIRHPQVSFQDGLIILFLDVKYDKYNAIVGIALQPEILSDGMLQIKLKSIKSGVLALPMFTLKEYLLQSADKVKDYINFSITDSEQSEKESVETALARFLAQALPGLLREGQFKVDPVINNPEDENKKIKLSEITIKDQQLTLGFTNSD